GLGRPGDAVPGGRLARGSAALVGGLPGRAGAAGAPQRARRAGVAGPARGAAGRGGPARLPGRPAPAVGVGGGGAWRRAAGVAVGLVAGLRAAGRGWPAWASAAGLCVTLALSLPICRTHWQEPLDDWWLPLAQANVLAAGVVALAWLALEPLTRRRERPGRL